MPNPYLKRTAAFLLLLLIPGLLPAAPWRPSPDYAWLLNRSYPSNQTRPWRFQTLANILAWTPATDADADYNRADTSRVPLRSKFTNSDYWANANARNEGIVSIVGPWYAGEPVVNQISSGGDYFAIYTHTFWQYVDIMVVWNFNLVASAELFDTAHRNGVKVYCLIINPSSSDLTDFVQKSGDIYPGADKLIEIAEYYGFDGWFFNFEASTSASTAEQLRDFMLYYNQQAAPKGIGLFWYDSMTESGNVIWQNELNDQNDWFFQYDGQKASSEFYLNYNNDNADGSVAHAQSLGRSPFDIHVGLETYQSFWKSGGVTRPIHQFYDTFGPGDSHKMSISCFQMNCLLDFAWDTQDDYYRNAGIFYVGEKQDPRDTAISAYDWKGLAHYWPAKSVINYSPFVTNFNTGHGYIYAIDGEILKKGEWHNRSLQDILPTWRWIVEGSGDKLTPKFDWSDAYYGGTCLSVSGDLNADNLVKLYMTSIPVGDDSQFTLAYKSGSAATHMKVALSLEDNPAVWEYLDVGAADSAEWNTRNLDLSAYSGRRIGAIGLFFDGSANQSGYEMKIGRLGVIEGGVDRPGAPSGLTVESKVEDQPGIASLRLKWTHSPSDVYHYNIYRRHPEDGTRSFLGGTTINAYLVPSCFQGEDEEETILEVEAVSAEFGYSGSSSTTFEWNDDDDEDD